MVPDAQLPCMRGDSVEAGAGPLDCRRKFVVAALMDYSDGAAGTRMQLCGNASSAVRLLR